MKGIAVSLLFAGSLAGHPVCLFVWITQMQSHRIRQRQIARDADDDDDDDPARRNWRPYSDAQIHQSEQHVDQLARRARGDVGQRVVLSVQKVGACAPSNAVTGDEIPLFPPMLDNALRMRLITHPLVETVIILLLPRKNASVQHASWAVFNAELSTYGITLIGNGHVSHSHVYSLDPLYATKVADRRKAQANAKRKRVRDELLEGRNKKISNARPPRPNDLLDFNGLLAMPTTDTASGSTANVPDLSVDAWIGAKEEDIQSFIDDRIRLVIHITPDVPFRITAFQFDLGVPIEI